MKILLAISRGINIKTYSDQITIKFIEFLSTYHTVGIALNRTYPNISGLTNVLIMPWKDAKFNEWDVVLVQDTASLRKVCPISTHYSLPVFFFMTSDSSASQPFIFKNLVEVLSLYRPFELSTVPKELISYHRTPASLTNDRITTKVTRRTDYGELKAVHYIQASDRNLSVAKSIISAANTMFNLEVTIIGDKNVLTILRPLINSNIALKSSTGYDQGAITNFDIILGSGPFAIEGLYVGIPTILIGSRGYGGLVTSENIEAHLKSHFDGRIGAELSENIPFKLFIEELNQLTDNYQLISTDTWAASSKIISAFNSDTIFSQLRTRIELGAAIFNSIKDNDFTSLKPTIVKGTKIVSDRADNIYILDQNFKLIGSLSSNDRKVVEQINNGHTVDEIALKTNTKSDDVKQLISELWNEKAIILTK